MHAFICIFFTSPWTFINFFIYKKLFFYLKNNCFTELCWFLPNISMNFFFPPKMFHTFPLFEEFTVLWIPTSHHEGTYSLCQPPLQQWQACDLDHQAHMPIQDLESEAGAVKYQAPDGIHFGKGSLYLMQSQREWLKILEREHLRSCTRNGTSSANRGTSGTSSRQFRKLFQNVVSQRFCDLTNILQ